MKQTELQNIKEVEELINKAEQGYIGTIIKIEETTSEKFFGETKYEDRKGYSVEIQLDENPEISWKEFFNIPKPLGVLDSKFYAFKKKYGVIPKEKLKVTCLYVDGNWRIAL